MEPSNKGNKFQKEHIASIFKEYTTPSRVLRSFTNLSNTVIQTALSGQSKFVFEILQNADDAFEDPLKDIEVKFILQDNYFIVIHNGKGFDFNDVERICDYASQIEEVKATDLSKTGYKGLGFKSLFNLSDCIYIHSNGYSFRFDKTYWPDSESKPWQVIPIWCEYKELPLNQKFSYDQPVNIILRVNDVSKLDIQLRELIDHPELLLFLYRINKLTVNLNSEEHFLERRKEKFGVFNKIDFCKNHHVESTWLSRTYKRSVFTEVQAYVQGASRFIYPEKIKKAKDAYFTFALRCDETLQEISKIKGLCYSTLPTQLYLTLPYHINSLFILNLDRTQLHENEWNEFLIYQIGYLQFTLLKDLAHVNYLKNYVIQLFVREINHPYSKFSKAYLKGFMEAKCKIGWLPPHQGQSLLKLGEVWTDETEFFKQNFQNIRDHKVYPYLINYDVKNQAMLLPSEGEAKHFTYDQLFRDFPSKYYPQLTRSSYVNFISYLYERLKGHPAYSKAMGRLKSVPFLLAKDGTLLSPKNALLEDVENPIPHFLLLNPIDNQYLPSSNYNLIKKWLSILGAKELTSPVMILRESILKWIESGDFNSRINVNNHIEIINYLAKCIENVTKREMEKLKEKLVILTKSNQFKLAKICYLPDTISIKELSNIILDEEMISSSYDMSKLRKFFIYVGVNSSIQPVEVLRKSILMWIKNGEVNSKLTKSNYKAIIEFISSHYTMLEYNLTEEEKAELRKVPVLTSDQIFQRAEVCYFDSAIPHVKGLENVIARNKIVSTKDVSSNVQKFLKKIGVQTKIAPVDVIRKTVLRWIHEGEITNRVTQDNHYAILRYIYEQWTHLKGGLKQKERKDLKRLPILTKSGVFKAVGSCYWSISDFDSSYSEEIPGLESVVSSDEFVSLNYDLKELKHFLGDLGVRNLTFIDIYEKYSDHLNYHDNVKWFFSKLVSYWKKHKDNIDPLLSYLQEKFCNSPCLLAKNGQIYSSRKLYSSRFVNIYDIDRNSVPLLDYDKLPEDLERFLGFKTYLGFQCIKQLLKAIGKKGELGEEKTFQFFTTLLEQLRQKDKNEIKKHQLSLLSQENKLRPAKDLNYFIEESATCYLDGRYLKRIPRMSHAETLELAELCGVNTLPFEQEIIREREVYDNTLKEFYLERLPFIVVQESKLLNEDVIVTLKRLYGLICAMKLYQCCNIYVKYPFGDTKIFHHFDNLTIYIAGKWKSKQSTIHDYLPKKLDLKIDIRDIIDMDLPITHNELQEQYSYQREDLQKISVVEEELRNLLTSKEKRELHLIISLESTNIAQANHSDYEEMLTTDESSDESFNMDHDLEIYLQKQTAANEKNNEISGACKSETITHCDATLHSKNEDAEKIYNVDQELIKLSCTEEKEELGLQTPAENVEVTQVPPSENGKNTFKELLKNLLDFKEIFTTTEVSSESSVDHIDQYTTKDEGCSDHSAFIDEPEIIELNEATAVSVISENQNSTKPDSRDLLPSKLEIDLKYEIQLEIPVCSPTESLNTGPSMFSSEDSEQSNIKWLNEKYVFTFLLDHYKSKYPLSEFNLSDGIFTLQWLYHKIEIIWLNAAGEKGLSCDLLLKKEGEVKRLIEVKSTDDIIANNDTFNVSHQTFVRNINKLASEFPEHKEKYCAYFVFTNNTSKKSAVELNNSNVLYKVMQLKKP